MREKDRESVEKGENNIERKIKKIDKGWRRERGKKERKGK